MPTISLKTTRKKQLIGLLILSMVFAYGFVPAISEAASFESAKDTISDSDRSVLATHTVVASTTVTIPAGGYFEVTFPAQFTTISNTNMTCPTGSTAGGSGQNLRCTFAGQRTATSSTIIMRSITNPASVGSYRITIVSRDSGDVILEQSTVSVAIVDDVTVTATVDSALTFTISGLATGAVVNGIPTTGSSTFQTIPYGTITSAASSTIAQRLNVTTNAAYGFTVTVWQDHNLLANNGADIDSFKDGVPGTAETWKSPTGVLGSEATYGHFGLSSDDSSLSTGDEYGTRLYKGFSGTTPMEVMYHTGAADGVADNIGSTSVAYTIQINALQEAGDYSNTLTYICTPTY